MNYLEAEIEARFPGAHDRFWYGVRLEDGYLAKGERVGIYSPGSLTVKADAEVLAISRNGHRVDSVEVEDNKDVRCAVELSVQPGDVPAGARLGRTAVQHARTYGLREDDLAPLMRHGLTGQ